MKPVKSMLRTPLFWMRAVCLALGALLLVLALCNPAIQENTLDLHNAGRDSVGPLVAGSVVTQSVEVPGELKEVGVRVSAVRDAKEMTLVLTLFQDGKDICT